MQCLTKPPPHVVEENARLAATTTRSAPVVDRTTTTSSSSPTTAVPAYKPIAPTAPTAPIARPESPPSNDQAEILRLILRQKEQEQEDERVARMLQENGGDDAGVAPHNANTLATDMALAHRIIQEEREAERQRQQRNAELQNKRDDELLARALERELRLAEQEDLERARREAQDRALARQLEAEEREEQERLRREEQRIRREQELLRQQEEAQRRFREDQEQLRQRQLALFEAVDITPNPDDVPHYWVGNTGARTTQLYDVKRNSWEWKKAQGLVQETVPHARIMRLQRIQNPNLWRWFVLRQAEVKAECTDGTRVERALFHGSRTGAEETIANEGFDFRLAQDGILGSGIYLSPSAATSLSYARTGSPHKRLLLCRATTGLSGTGTRGLKRPPARPVPNHTKYYHSVSGSQHYCLFENYLAYPEYMITIAS